ncbi:MAG TPA: UvrD-helicase domain-containing protein [Paenalcaligenes sp.]|nr:UvrD-helicase domain-containing protein [Paenalcaligenes sp.]
MNNRRPSDYLVRERAISIEHSFLVEAPAGSGKTELLTDRILALLAVVRKPEEIVAITFTRKAAAEMHQRVIEKLSAAHQEPPAEEHLRKSWSLARAALQRDSEQGWDLLNYPARLAIRTIDSLCAHLVQAMPWSSGLGGMPDIAENADELYQQAAVETLLQATPENSIGQVLAHLNMSFSRAEDLIVEMLKKREQWLPVIAETSDVALLENNLYELIECDLRVLAEALPFGWADELAPLTRFAYESLVAEGRKCDFEALSDWQGENFSPTVDELARWQGLASFLLTTQGELRRPGGINRTRGFAPKAPQKEQFTHWLEAQDATESWIALLSEVRHYPFGYTDEQSQILQHLVMVLRQAAAHLWVIFAEQRAVDFNEISQRALTALGHAQDPTELLLRLDRNIQHLLVDEFQDTSQLQMQILERIVSGWQPDDGRTVFLVGDPMQSIYRFRKAEVGLFLEMKSQAHLGPVELEVLQLKENFRSHPGLVEWVNQAGPQLLATQNDSEFGAVAFNAAQPFHPGSGTRVQVHDIWQWYEKELPDAEKERRKQGQQQEAQARVIELCQQALQQYDQQKSPVGILVRGRAHLAGLVRALTQAGVPCRAVELDPLGSRPAVQDLIQLVRALVHPGDRMAWLALLRSPLCGLKLNSLFTLCSQADKHTPIPALLQRLETLQPQLPADEYERLLWVANGLDSTTNKNGAATFPSWVQRCWQQLGGAAIYHSPTDQEDVEQVFRLLDEIAPYGNLDLQLLEEQVAELFAAPSNVSPAVEVMTIHKSKGLEFESVILYGLDRQVRGDTIPLVSFEVGPTGILVGPIAIDKNEPGVADFMRKREAKRAENELRRLLYVALTRARSELHLIANMTFDADKGEPKKPATNVLLERLWTIIETEIQVPTAPSEQQQTAAAESDTAVGNQLKRISSQAWADLDLQAQRQALQQRKATTQSWHWSVPAQDESAVGQVAHAWLERIARDGIEHWSTERLQTLLPAIERQLMRTGCTRDYLSTGVSEVLDALNNTLNSERGRWLLTVAKAQREWSLLDHRGRVSIIDLAIDQQDHWLVVDYKTTIPHDGEELYDFKQRMLRLHQEQLQRYCSQVTALDGRPARAALYFPRIDLWVEHKSL